MTTQIIQFKADTCAPCKQLSSVLAALPSSYGASRINVMDVETNPEEARKYGVRAVPTLVRVDDSTGTVVSTLVGLPTVSKLKEWLTQSGESVNE